MHTPSVTDEEFNRYQSTGFVQLSGLIPAEVSARATATYQSMREADPAPGNKFGAAHKTFEHPDFRACYTAEFYSAMGQLLGVEPGSFPPPGNTYTITGVQQTEDLALQPHIDRMLLHSPDPGYRIFAMTFLSDVSLDGGGTVVWPGSHQLIRRLQSDEPERYPTLDEIQTAITSGEVAIGEPVLTTPSLGDVIFVEALLVHSGGVNRSDRERFALNWKW